MISHTASVSFRTSILDPSGKVIKTNPTAKNLLLDSGLDLIASQPWAKMFEFCAIGTDATPVKRRIGTATFSLNSGTITASESFFEISDIGRLFKFDSGEETYITAFLDSENVVCDSHITITTPENATVWYVNQTGLITETKRTNTYGAESSDNGTVYIGNGKVRMWRTFIFSPEPQSITYREIGWSHSASTGGNLLGRAIIPGGGDGLTAGQQYKVVVELTLTVNPWTAQAVGNVMMGDYDSSGVACLQGLGLNGSGRASISYVQANGKTEPGFSLEPSVSNPYIITIDSSNFEALDEVTSNNVPLSGFSGTDPIQLTAEPYAARSRFRLYKAKFSVNQSNYHHYGVVIGRIFTTTPPTIRDLAFALTFDTPQQKDSDHTLEFHYRISWGRTLEN